MCDNTARTSCLACYSYFNEQIFACAATASLLVGVCSSYASALLLQAQQRWTLAFYTVIISVAACFLDSFCMALRSNLHSAAMQLQLVGRVQSCWVLTVTSLSAVAELAELPWLCFGCLTEPQLGPLTETVHSCSFYARDQPLCLQQLPAIVPSHRPQYKNWLSAVAEVIKKPDMLQGHCRTCMSIEQY